LLPIGQFGTRNMGGKDFASPRYIYTNLSKIVRIIFNENDEHCLEYVEDDGL
jgi:DNA topoisomerase-2